MYRERLVATEARSESARRLQQLLLDYHDFRHLKAEHPLLENAFHVADWQAERLKATHEDLYHHPGYHHGLEFLLTDLYAPAGMTHRGLLRRLPGKPTAGPEGEADHPGG